MTVVTHGKSDMSGLSFGGASLMSMPSSDDSRQCFVAGTLLRNATGQSLPVEDLQAGFHVVATGDVTQGAC